MRISKGNIVIDNIDKKMLSILQNNGRISNADLAKKIDMTPPPCFRRLELLENHKVIQSYQANVDSKILGWNITFQLIVTLDTQKEAMLSDFERLILTWPEVREIHMIRSGGDFLLKLVAKSTDHENNLIHKIISIPYVKSIQTFQIIRTVKCLSGIPV